MSEKSCSTFYCDLRGGRYCCAFCPDPCKNRCLNHPDRCKLAKDKTPIVPKRPPKLTPAQREELIRLITEGKLSGKQIAAQMGITGPAVAWQRRKLKAAKGEERGQ